MKNDVEEVANNSTNVGRVLRSTSNLVSRWTKLSYNLELKEDVLEFKPLDVLLNDYSSFDKKLTQFQDCIHYLKVLYEVGTIDHRFINVAGRIVKILPFWFIDTSIDSNNRYVYSCFQ